MKNFFVQTTLILTLSGLLSACGYTLQNSRSSLVEVEKIHKIFIAPIKNDTFKVGVENILYNSLIRAISARQAVEIVKNREDSDAVLSGKIFTAQYHVNTSTLAQELQPRKTGPDNVQVATLYLAGLDCSFELNRLNEQKNEGKKLWAASFSRSKIFSANNKLGVLGTTSALINDSEFERALEVMADNMTIEVQEAFLSMF